MSYEIAVLIPKELLDKTREKVLQGTKDNEIDDQSLILWVLENFLDS